MTIKRIALYANITRLHTQQRTIEEIVLLLQKRDVEVVTSIQLPQNISHVKVQPEAWIQQHCQLVLVIGGDGTFLRAAHSLGVHGLPMLGINKGHLGFLSELEEDAFVQHLDSLIQGHFQIEKRMLIQAHIYRDQVKIGSAFGLNDLVINRHHNENSIDIEVYHGKSLIDRYSGDGLILATPTGSTGYALSAGGPLIYPGTDCLLVTPICSHFLGTRAVIVPATDTLDIKITRMQEKAYFVADGLACYDLLEGDYIHVERSKDMIQMVHLCEHPFFEAVRHKLLNRDYRKW